MCVGSWSSLAGRVLLLEAAAAGTKRSWLLSVGNTCIR